MRPSRVFTLAAWVLVGFACTRATHESYIAETLPNEQSYIWGLRAWHADELWVPVGDSLDLALLRDRCGVPARTWPDRLLCRRGFHCPASVGTSPTQVTRGLSHCRAAAGASVQLRLVRGSTADRPGFGRHGAPSPGRLCGHDWILCPGSTASTSSRASRPTWPVTLFGFVMGLDSMGRVGVTTLATLGPPSRISTRRCDTHSL